MTLNYTLTANDFLQHQLFVASKSNRIKKQRTRTWLIYSASLLLLGFLFYQSGNSLMTYYFLIFGLISLCFFPLYQKWYYKRHYEKFVADTYKNRFGQTENIEFNEDCIETNDITGQSKINLNGIENATETNDYFYLEMKTGGHLIIPKQKVDKIEYIQQELKRLCHKLSIDYLEDLKWRWK